LLAVTPLLSRLPYFAGLMRLALRDEPLGFALDQAGNALLCLAALLVPTACLGVGFPLVSRIEARHAAEIGTRVGATYAWNTAGNVLGVLVTCLVLLPAIGWLQAFPSIARVEHRRRPARAVGRRAGGERG
jgi:predicted membrane-bound spermidine synthase